jgi:prepilin-type N-terminal cleavage/methylation domain-containing protein
MADASRQVRDARGGFTLAELLVAVLVLGVLMGLLVVGIRYATSAARGSVDAANVAGLRMGVDRFRDEFGFLPPLVRDMDDQTAASNRRVVRVGQEYAMSVYDLARPADRDRLRARGIVPAQFDYRFSENTLAYYLLGVLERKIADGVEAPIDGVVGPGMLRPNTDGTFMVPAWMKTTAPPATTRQGQRWEAFVAAGKRGMSVEVASADPDDVRIVDRNGKAYRYYRWLRGRGTPPNPDLVQEPGDLNIPILLTLIPGLGPRLNDAEYAVVAAGPDGLFGNEHQLPVSHPDHLPLMEMARKLGLPSDAPEGRVVETAARDNRAEVGR